MIRRSCLAAAVLIGMWATPGAAQTSPASEEAAVRAAVDHYLQAHATGQGSHIRLIFHPKLELMWAAGDTLNTRTAEAYAAGFRGQPPADEAQRKRWIESVDIGGTAAVAKVILDYPATRFTDYLSLLKLNGEWKVVAKVFAAEAKR